ncbi:MAG: CooT family nickel-binding protein [Spirochaetaceae bacterium]|jgi:predicted RNA-binding protein|nr:CooT family nickel-binding protein [Spirochaetaceae bacterium]
MCLSTAWEIDEKGGRIKIREHISSVRVSGSTVTLTDLMGEEVVITGILQSIDLVKNDILVMKTAAVTAGIPPVKRYERIREIFNRCENNQMRDVDIAEITSGDIDAEVKTFCVGETVTCDKQTRDGRVTVFDICTDGMNQRLTYTLID